MPDTGYVSLTRQIGGIPRRMAFGGMLASVAGLRWLGASDHALAKKKRRKKRKKKSPQPPSPPVQCPTPPLQCPAGQQICAGVCCSPDKECVGGTCQCKTLCGAVCCLNGQVCENANTHTCGCLAGSCPIGCDCGVAAGGMRVCYESVLTDCEEVQFCASNFECPVGSACNPTTCDSPICFPLCAA